MFSAKLISVLEKVKGSQSIFIMDGDGLFIDKAFATADRGNETLAVECTSLIKNSLTFTANPQINNLQEIILNCDELRIIIRIIAPNYYLLLFTGVDANLGKARYELLMTKYDLEEDFY
jgi:predicted regulator of Ras-like GTPase activity (Roadblock/LC7/MglB family)